MKLNVTALPGCLVLEPSVFGDSRGFFYEAWNRSAFLKHGLNPVWVQGNVSGSNCGVLRGLHYQWPGPQGKLVSVLEGEVFDVAVDLRVGSPAFGRWHGELLSAENRLAMWVPPGFAHGFVVLSTFARFAYLVTAQYDRGAEVSLRWDDPALNIRWPINSPILSDKDALAPTLDQLPADRLPVLQECASC